MALQQCWHCHGDGFLQFSQIQLSKYVAVNMATAHAHYEPDGATYNLGSSFTSGACYNIIKIHPNSTNGGWSETHVAMNWGLALKYWIVCSTVSVGNMDVLLSVLWNTMQAKQHMQRFDNWARCVVIMCSEHSMHTAQSPHGKLTYTAYFPHMLCAHCVFATHCSSMLSEFTVFVILHWTYNVRAAKHIGCFNHRVVTMVAVKLKRQWLC